MNLNTSIKTITLGLAAATAFAGAALADGMDKGSLKDAAPAADARKFDWTANVGVTSNYVFRGISQSKDGPAISGGLDATYGLLYAGLWTSSIDFGKTNGAVVPYTGPLNSTTLAHQELDLYAGIKPTWGPLSFDFGIIAYLYPNSNGSATTVYGSSFPVTGIKSFDYYEGKAAVSGNVGKLALGETIYWSPEYTNKTGDVWTFESTAGYELSKVWIFTPTVGATLGYQVGDSQRYKDIIANGDDNYLYWNAGVALAADKWTLDFRYWDTNISNNNSKYTNGFCDGADQNGRSTGVGACGSTFVFSAKLTLP